MKVVRVTEKYKVRYIKKETLHREKQRPEGLLTFHKKKKKAEDNKMISLKY